MNAQQQAVLTDWRRFITGGFELKGFTPDLYHHLIQHCALIDHYDREGFWQHYFDGNVETFFDLINQFGGDLRAAEAPAVTNWFMGPESDPGIGELNMKMIAEAREIGPTLREALLTMAQQEYDIEMWGDLNTHWQQLAAAGMGTAEALSHLRIIYELTFPFEAFASVYTLSPQARQRLAQIRAHRTDTGQQDLFTVRSRMDSRRPAPQPTVTEQGQPGLSLFDTLPAPRQQISPEMQARIDRLSPPSHPFSEDERAARMRRLSALDAATNQSSLSLPLNGKGKDGGGQ